MLLSFFNIWKRGSDMKMVKQSFATLVPIFSKNICTHNTTADIYYCSIFHDNNEKTTSLFMLQ